VIELLGKSGQSAPFSHLDWLSHMFPRLLIGSYHLYVFDVELTLTSWSRRKGELHTALDICLVYTRNAELDCLRPGSVGIV
jgi:hypothetical protein